ncbi:MAG: hypothetical protein ACI8W3_000568 [Myxococcota bacterium]|jgi:hypothetical protein
MHDWAFVELFREYIAVNRTLRSLFVRFRQGAPCFEDVALLVGDTDSSMLFRLKERCHALFRRESSVASDLHREVLFDLTVGSLFHEAMKLRENLYQHEVYVPKVESLLAQHGPGDGDFFDEFEKIQATGADRTMQAMAETEALLEQTRNQLRGLLEGRPENGLMTRNLVENRGAVEEVFDCDLAEILAGIHGGVLAGFAAAAHSYLESAFFSEAIVCLADAEVASVDDVALRAQLLRLANYAKGMMHFSAGEYAESFDSLDAWLEASPGVEEEKFLAFASSALSRVTKLINQESESELQARAAQLVTRIASRTKR